jgi:hypothetical protein
MNDSSAYLWKIAMDKEFSENDLIVWLTEEYDVTESVASSDVKTLVQKWEEAGIIEL